MYSCKVINFLNVFYTIPFSEYNKKRVFPFYPFPEDAGIKHENKRGKESQCLPVNYDVDDDRAVTDSASFPIL